MVANFGRKEYFFIHDYLPMLNANSISNIFFFLLNFCLRSVFSVRWLTDLKVLVRQVDLQAEWVDSLGEWPGLQLSQRKGVLTESC